MKANPLLKGTLKTIVMKLLAEKGEMYGYEITQIVKSLSDGKIEITEGALYPTLHKLEKEGLLRTNKVMVGKRVRKYYELTPKGNEGVRKLVSEFHEFVNLMGTILRPTTR